MSDPLHLRPVDAEIGVRNVILRMPPKYGATVCRGFPFAYLTLTLEGPGGVRVKGYAGDCLPPGWYDKRPNRTFRNDVDELAAALMEGRKTLMDLARGGPRSVFGFWRELYPHQIKWARERGVTDITGNFGTTMCERALLDGAGKLAGKTYHALIKDNLPGIEPETVHPFLKDWHVREALAPEPLTSIAIRHTVGGLDPLTEADVPAGQRLRDGLPQTLEDYLKAERIRYFKIKLKGNAKADLERLGRIAALLDQYIPAAEKYYVTYDGNEVYADPAELMRLLEQAEQGGVPKRFAQAVLFVEQPFPRAITLSDAIRADLARISKIKSVIIDESDETVESVPRALDLGYAGFAIKSAKGPLKALLNAGVTQRHPKRPAQPIISGEDMCNLPVVALHEDLVVMSAMGMTHAERNGHHYSHGLNHLSDTEQAALLKNHPKLIHRLPNGLVALNADSGAFEIGTLVARPGLGVSDDEIDAKAMVRLEDWKFESLGIT